MRQRSFKTPDAHIETPAPELSVQEGIPESELLTKIGTTINSATPDNSGNTGIQIIRKVQDMQKEVHEAQQAAGRKGGRVGRRGLIVESHDEVDSVIIEPHETTLSWSGVGEFKIATKKVMNHIWSSILGRVAAKDFILN